MQKHPFDLEKRTTSFAKNVIFCCKKIRRTPINDQIIKQLVRSSGSVGANYMEANDALGIKDFIMRLRISRKESKETVHWLELLEAAVPEHTNEISQLTAESVEIKNILSAILNNSINNHREELGKVWVR